MSFFQTKQYGLDNGTIVSMRVDRNDLFTANVQATGVPLLHVANRRSARAQGLSPRQFKLRKQIVAEDVAAGIPGVYRYKSVTILTKAVFDAAVIGDIVDFGGVSYLLHSKLPEVNRV
jgi:hypothetical protein